ncbi:hypothetical protein [Nostoc sp.]|uniref:hypothetical protein n=1 Tax=Nostoc sp. TaxID=1180 RepID=UPI002FF53C16
MPTAVNYASREWMGLDHWRDLLLQQGLDITATNLQQELTRELPAINRQIAGFEDFAFEGKRAIEAGNPSRNLLFHALVSPNIVSANLSAYPTLVELEIIRLVPKLITQSVQGF